MDEKFADVLGFYIGRMEYSARQLARLSSVPQKTIVNWLSGRVRRPHQWQKIVLVADALHLEEAEADRLLKAASHQTISNLRGQFAGQKEEAFFARWPLPSAAPFQARVKIPYFVRREARYQSLGDSLRQGKFVTIYSFKGMGGVGKTALANHLAHELRAAFPDGILWANLETSSTMSILLGFASAYGENVAHLQDVESRAAAVRAILANKKALIVLDNAQKSSQVRPLLPPDTGKTAVIITTRHDLAIADDMQHFQVNPFSVQKEEALYVFSHFLSAATVRRWQKQLNQIANMLGHLPLAIALAAAQLAKSNNVPDYLERLEAAEKRLDSLVREDRNVRLSFMLSFEQLSTDLQHFFMTLGSLAPADFSVFAAASIANLTDDQAASYLKELTHYSLVTPENNQRYQCHTLLRDFAREFQKDAEWDRRMVEYFSAYAEANRGDSNKIALEQPHLVETLKMAEQYDWAEPYIQATLGFFPFLYTTGASNTAVLHLEKAIQYATKTEQFSNLAKAYANVGSAYWSLGQFQLAEARLKEGLAIARREEQAQIILVLLINLSSVVANQGDMATARLYLEEAHELSEQLNNIHQKLQLSLNLAALAYEEGDWATAEKYYLSVLSVEETQESIGKGTILLAYNNLGIIKFGQGNYKEAKAYTTQSLQISKTLNDPNGSSLALSELALLAIEEEDYSLAATHLSEALQLANAYQRPEAIIRVKLYTGLLAARQTNVAEAFRLYEEALQQAQENNIVWNIADVLIHLGDLFLEQQNMPKAKERYEEALAIGEKVNAPEINAVCDFGLAQVYLATGHKVEAKAFATKSLAVLQRLGHKKTAEIQQWLKNI